MRRYPKEKTTCVLCPCTRVLPKSTSIPYLLSRTNFWLFFEVHSFAEKSKPVQMASVYPQRPPKENVFEKYFWRRISEERPSPVHMLACYAFSHCSSILAIFATADIAMTSGVRILVSKASIEELRLSVVDLVLADLRRKESKAYLIKFDQESTD